MLIFDVLALIKNVQYVLKILLHLHHVIICWNKVSDTDAIMLHAFMLMHSQEMKNCFFLSLPFLEPNHGEYSTRGAYSGYGFGVSRILIFYIFSSKNEQPDSTGFHLTDLYFIFKSDSRLRKFKYSRRSFNITFPGQPTFMQFTDRSVILIYTSAKIHLRCREVKKN